MELTFKQFIELRYGTDRYLEIRDACYCGTDPISKGETFNFTKTEEGIAYGAYLNQEMKDYLKSSNTDDYRQGLVCLYQKLLNIAVID